MRVSEAGIRPPALNEMKNHRPQAFIKSLGCISNLLDGTGYEQLVIEAGYRLTKKINNADLILINTCAFNRIKEDEAIQFIRHAGRRMQENARILVCGCLPKINQERLRTIHAGITFGPRDPSALLDLLRLNAMHQVQSSGPISYTQYSPLKKTIYQTKRLMETVPGINKLPFYRRLLAPFFYLCQRSLLSKSCFRLLRELYVLRHPFRQRPRIKQTAGGNRKRVFGGVGPGLPPFCPGW